jgi:malonate-semialdehyde dehydrogenase (acetylating)/methylmalonate-semialdehyde dehydrogenase
MRRALTRARALPAITARSSRISSTITMPSAAQNMKVATRRLHATAQHLKPAAALAHSTIENVPSNHEKIQQVEDTPWFIDNQFVKSEASQWIDLHDPATNNLVTRVPQSTDAELKAAVESANKAFPKWKATSVIARQQIMFKFVELVRQNWDRLAASITIEQGKTLPDAKGDVLRGLQVAEMATSAAKQMAGQVLEVAKDMETKEIREPLGVVASICPFSKSTKRAPSEDWSDICDRLPCHDSTLVYSNCYGHWKLSHPEAF